MPTILAAGAELKNTFCVTRENYAFLSHHIGDLENYETLRSFEDGVAHFERLVPHPAGDHRVRSASELSGDALCVGAGRAGWLESDRRTAPSRAHRRVHGGAWPARRSTASIGVAFDGTGYGTDGAIWGGEFLIADYRGFERAAHLEYMPLPGGDAATKHPYRIALSYLRQVGIEWADDLAPVRAASSIERATLRKQIESNLNTFPTSSMGRLFDAVASICDVRQNVNYEGQAAIEFEALADEAEQGAYPFEVEGERD